jgi:protein-tyrosine sulfotransferase
LHDLLLRMRAGIPGVGYPLHGTECYAPFFIIGSGRSGNTLLRSVLQSHPLVHIPPETYVLGQVIKVYRRFSGTDWRELVKLILAEFEYHPGFSMFQVSLRPLCQRLIEVEKEHRNLAYILDAFYRYHAAEFKPGATIWGDKTPTNTFSVFRIRKVFPHARFIHMVRDGCDVASSYLEMGGYTSLEEAARRWAVSVKLAQRFGASFPETYLEIRYEELVKNPERVVKDACNFLGISYSERMLSAGRTEARLVDVETLPHLQNVGNPISTSGIGRGRRMLTPNQKLALDRLIGDDLEALGYQRCTA